MKFSLSNIKIAIFDLDDTFAIHKDVDYVKHRSENKEKLYKSDFDLLLEETKR